jgi:hypothetical protein
MTIRNIISEIVAEWPKYKESRKVDKNSRAYDLVVNAFPGSLQSIAENTDYLKFHGSTGQGNITAAPWVATFDTRITSSATSGFYVVYLFSIDLKSIFLEFGFGTTQFTNHFKKKLSAIKKYALQLENYRNVTRKNFFPCSSKPFITISVENQLI